MTIDATIPISSVSDSVSDVGDKILRRLDELGMTQRELAARSGLDEQTISNYVRGVHLPRRRRSQVALAKGLGGAPNDWAPTVDDLVEQARLRAEQIRREADGR